MRASITCLFHPYHPLEKKISQKQTDEGNRAVHASEPRFSRLQNGCDIIELGCVED